MVSRNSCKNSGVIQRSDQKLRCFWGVTVVWHDETCSSPSSASIVRARKTASGNCCKRLSTIQRSDKKLEPFLVVTLVRCDRTFTSHSRDSIATTRKMASKNSCKNSGVIQRSDPPLLWSGAIRPSLHRVEISYLLRGKRHPKTPVQIQDWSIGRIKSSEAFEPLCWNGSTRPALHREAIPFLPQGNSLRKLM
jgi:hypothetical protein